MKRLGILFLAMLSVLAAACSGAPAEPTPTVAPTATPTEAAAEPAEAAAPEEAADASLSGVQTFTIVTDESSATYVVNEEFFELALEKLGINAGETVVRGTTQNVSGVITVDLDNPGQPAGETRIQVDLTGLSTDQRNRDRWLQNDRGGPNFARFPVAEFVATGIEGMPAAVTEGEEVTFNLLGDLTIREITQPVTFAVTAQLDGDTLAGNAQANLLITDFGFEPPSFARTLTVENEFVVEVTLVARADG